MRLRHRHAQSGNAHVTSVTGGTLKPMKACDADKKLMQAINARNH
jgi:hypothetical protein